MIPERLRELRQWVGWRYVDRDGKSTKIPLSPAGGLARANDSATWGGYADARSIDGAAGVGFVFTDADPFVGLDMDGVVSEAGLIDPAARGILDRFRSFTEFSPSERGLHVICEGRIKRNRSTLHTPWGMELAAFASGKFFTVTGDGRGEIVVAQDALDWLHRRFFREPRVHVPVARPAARDSDDDALVELLASDPATAALWAGDCAAYNGDHSAADLALCSRIARMVGGDASRVDRIFRRSGLMRDKWDAPRSGGTYGARTVARACRG